MKKNILLNLIGIIIIVIIVLIVIIMNLTKNKEMVTEENEVLSNEQEIVEENTAKELSPVEDINTFCMVESCVQKYYDYITSENFNAVNSILDKEYKQKNQITMQNINQKIDLTKNLQFTAVAIEYIQEKPELSINVVEGLLINKDKNTAERLYYIVKCDFESGKYSINPIKEKVKNINTENTVDNTQQENIFQLKNLTDVQILEEYLKNYTDQLLFYPQKAYELLDKEYASKRFNNSYDEFKTYISDIRDNLNANGVSKYRINYEDDKTLYEFLDSYNNYFAIESTKAMVYTIKLDDYTITSSQYQQKYNSATNEQKVYANIQKFFKMINNRDYKAAYNLVDSTFRNNNFNTIDKFKNFANSNFYKNTIVKNDAQIVKQGIYYVCNVTIASGENVSADSKEIKFIMSLEDGLDFKLSFNMD